MKKTTLIAIAAFCVALAGCDQNAFTEDFPTPDMNPYLAFDHTQLLSPGGFTYVDATVGSRRNIAHPAAAAAITGLRPRLPMALGENVLVTFDVTGNAVRGTDFRIDHFDVNQPGCVSPFNMAQCWVVNTNNQITIEFRDEDWPAAGQSPIHRDLRIVVFPNPASTSTRTVQLRITGATAASTGRPIDVGRLPGNRDQIVTLNIAAP